MKLASSIKIKREVGSVFSFMIEISNIGTYLSLMGIDRYEIELEDDVAGQIYEGMELSIFLWAKYEGDKDYVVDIEFIRVDKDKEFIAKVVDVGVYESDENDSAKFLNMERFLKKMEFGLTFEPYSGGTIIKEFFNLESDMRMFKLILYILRLASYFSTRKYLKMLSLLVETRV